MLTYTLISIGAVFALIGIILFIKGIGESTSSKIKFLALEFESKGSSLIIFLVGAALIVFGARNGDNKTDKEQTTRTEKKDLEMTSFMPPKIGSGDGNFNTHHDEHMSLDVRGEIMLVEANTLKYRLYMHAKEERYDWTEVGGYTEWFTAYTAPVGWKINSFRPNTNSKYTGSITTHGDQTYYRPAGEIVQKFQVWGDHQGNEAGTWTKMDVYWRSIEVEIEKLVQN